MTRQVLRCMTCKTPVPAVAPRPSYYPFCSERCQLIDLGKWLDEEYRVTEPDDQAGGGAEPVRDERE